MKIQNPASRACSIVIIGLVLMAATAARASYQSTVLADNPLAYYPLDPGDNGTNTAPDLSGNGLDGAMEGVGYATGPSAYITNAASFNGSTATIDLSVNDGSGLLNFTGPITMEAWAQPSSTTEFGDVVAKGYDSSSYDEIVIRVNGPYGANYYGSSGSTGLNGGSQNTTWTHIVLSSDGINCSLYQNGVLVARAGDTSGSVQFADDWMIGNGSSAGNGRFFNGNISEVAIYNYGLSGAQVLNHYYQGLLNAAPAVSRPIINTQPQSQQSYVGGSVTFSVATVSALPVTNQWYYGVNPLPGQTNSTLTLLNLQLTNAGSFSVVIGNANGTTNSAAASLTVSTPRNLEWSASGNSGVWDAGISANWINLSNSQATVFDAGDAVTFDDTTGVPTSVTVSNNVAPSIWTVNSSANAFTFNGPGSITGSGTLIKEGASTLTLVTPAAFTGNVLVEGGVVYAGNNTFNDVAAIGVTNGATLDFGGGQFNNIKPVTVSGSGFNGEGALFNSYANYPLELLNLTLAGDTTVGGSARWDMATGSQISGAHQLTLNWGGGAGYGEWNSVTVGPTVPGITLTNGSIGMKFMDTGFQNPATLFTISPNDQMTFYNGGYNGSIHALAGAQIYVYTAPAPFNGSTMTFENNTTWASYYNSGADTSVNSALILNGVVHFVIGDHNMIYSNVVSGPGGFVSDYYNHATVFSASNTYTGPTVIGNGPEVALTGNGSISHSALIFFGASQATGACMDVTGRSDQTLTLASGQTLGGIGSVNGSLVVASGATLAPGGTNTTIGITVGANPVGGLTASDNLTLNGTTVIKLAAPGSNDVVEAGGNLTFGGVLNLVNISGAPLTAGESFQIFTVGILSGSFASVTPATPGPGLAWDLSQLGSGQISVMTAPTIASTQIVGPNLVISGSGGRPGGTYYVVTTTNVATPLAAWTPIATNQYDGSGNFTATNSLAPTASQRYYSIKE